jgi:hypothetical protein
MPAVCLQTVVREKRRRRRKRLLLYGGIWIVLYTMIPRKPKRLWQREWLSRRGELGAYETLIAEMREEDEASFLNFLRMSPGTFDELLMKVTPLIDKHTTNLRKPISPGIRLAVTLRYLATGI